jgi:hypothetical protein
MKNKFTKILFATVLTLSISTLPVIASTSVAAAATKDPTRGLSKAKRALVSFEVWIASPAAARVIKKESHGNCKAIGGGGKYRGKWQMNAGFWKTHGGLQFAKSADKATCEQQDQVAYQGWLARGWQPWGLR